MKKLAKKLALDKTTLLKVSGGSATDPNDSVAPCAYPAPSACADAAGNCIGATAGGTTTGRFSRLCDSYAAAGCPTP